MKIYHYKTRDRSIGLTLIEILVSIVLVGIIAIFVAIAIPTSATLSNRTDEMETTTILAQKYIEDVKSSLKANSAIFDSLQAGTTPPISIQDEHTNNDEYSVTTQLSIENTATVNDVDVPTLALLMVTVAPIADDSAVLTGSDQTVTISTLLRRDR